MQTKRSTDETSRSRIGAEKVPSAQIGSPFNYLRQMRLYVVKSMPDPNEETFEAVLIRWIEHFVTQSTGRAFVLFTSYRLMQRVAGAMQAFFAEMDWQLLVQGSGKPRAALVEDFKQDIHSVLFGTYEGTKRLMVPSLGESSLKDDENNVHYGNLLAIGLAGGIAGSAQHVVSNYTETVCVTSYSKIWQNDMTLVQRCRLMPRFPLPSVRTLAFAFFPSSLGFIAFEYGKEIMTGDDDT